MHFRTDTQAWFSDFIVNEIGLLVESMTFWAFDSSIAKSFLFMFYIYFTLMLWDQTASVNPKKHCCMTGLEVLRNRCWEMVLNLFSLSLECWFRKLWGHWSPILGIEVMFCDCKIIATIFCSISKIEKHSIQHWCWIQLSRVFFSLGFSNWYATCPSAQLWWPLRQWVRANQVGHRCGQ